MFFNFLKLILSFILKNLLLLNLLLIIIFILSIKCLNFYFGVSFFITWNIFLLFYFKNSKFIILINFIFLLIFLLFNYTWNCPNHFNNDEFTISNVKKNYVILSKRSLNLYFSSFNNHYVIGQNVVVTGCCENVNLHSNPWEFNFDRYLKENNIEYQLSKNSNLKIIKTSNIKFLFYNWLNTKSDIEKIFFTNIKEGELYSSLTDLSLTFLTNMILPLYFFISKIISKVSNNKRKNAFLKLWIAQFFLLFIFIQSTNIILIKSYLFITLSNGLILFNKTMKKVNMFSIIWSTELIINPCYIFNIGFVYITIFFLFYKRIEGVNKWLIFLKSFLLLNLINLPIQCFYDYKIFWTSSFIQILMFPFMLFSYVILIPSFIFDINLINHFVNQFLLKLTNIISKVNLTTNVGHFSFLFLIAYFLGLKAFILSENKVVKCDIVN